MTTYDAEADAILAARAEPIDDVPAEIRRMDAENAAIDETYEQTAGAARRILLAPERYLRWPWDDLDAMTGGMAPGDVWMAAAFAGSGKTTFTASAIDCWWQQGKRIYVMPLETRADTFRATWACMRIGVHPGDAMSGEIRRAAKQGNLEAESDIQRILAEIDRQKLDGAYQSVRVSSTKAINLTRLKRAVEEAKDWGADVVIVDHIDHIQGGDGSNATAESKAVNHAALELAQDHDMLLLFTSQLNNEILKNGDYLSRYAPPKENHLLYPGVKNQVATGIIGLFRPIRERRPDEQPRKEWQNGKEVTVDPYADAVKAARTGTAEAKTVLEPDCQGVVNLKVRNTGSKKYGGELRHVGTRGYLGYQHGRIVDLDPLRRAERQAKQHGIKTNRDVAA